MIFIYQIFRVSMALKDNTFIVDYFVYKNSPFVVGFSCNDALGDRELAKNLSEAGIYSSLDTLYSNYTIKPFLYTVYYKLGVFLDLRCYDAIDTQYILTKSSYARLYGEQHYWLILGKDLNESIKLLNDTEYSISTDLVVAIENGNEFQMFDAFNHCKYRGGALNITYFGNWNIDTRMNVSLKQAKFRRRSNYHGMILRMAGLVTNRPKDVSLEDYLQDYSTKQQDSMAKFTYAIWTTMAELFNFTIEAKELTVWKPTNRNGPIIKMLIERTAELGGSTGIPTPERLSVINPIPVWPLRTCFMFRTTQSKHIKVNHFLRPLAAVTWYLTVVLMITATIVFAWVLVTEQMSNKFERYSAAFLFTIGSVCQQGSDLQITGISSRIAFLQTMLFSLLIYNYYSASVVSARLSEPLEKINDSLNELAKTNLKFGAEPSLYFNFFIKRSDWEAQQFYYKQWVKVPENERFMEAIVGIKRILQGDFAYHIDVNAAFPVIERLFDNQQICQLTMVYLVRPTDSSIFMASNGSFVELVKVGIAKIREIGLRTRLVKRWAARAPECRTDILVIDPVTIYEAAPAFLLLIFGIIFGVFLCTIERITYCKKYHDHGVKKKLHKILSRFYATEKKK
ncbi:uncharacterized protein LOC111694150 [Trichogramma pretiosum]|uniref:uncharacterized protein LOC111694150 n=1 Tax=Trichogramma pretiosum TaxID=7493 RepID=UPI000C719522|nr:uncharacterized protein LOC111694150 [Trichogramma pretiosum]